MTTVYDFPQDWYKFSSATFRIKSRSQVANRTWIGGNNVKGPHAQGWVTQLTLSTLKDPLRQDVAAFFSRLDGQAGLLRIADPTRLRPWYDRNIIQAVQGFTDGSRFTDGSGFTSSFLPAFCYVIAAANKGDNYIQLGGLPASTASVFRRGDMMQVKPNGVATVVPNLYEAQIGGGTDASGQIGLEVRPRLRQNFTPGDQVSLRYPASVFRCIDDDQGVIQMTAPGDIGSGAFSLIEALDQIP